MHRNRCVIEGFRDLGRSPGNVLCSVFRFSGKFGHLPDWFTVKPRGISGRGGIQITVYWIMPLVGIDVGDPSWLQSRREPTLSGAPTVTLRRVRSESDLKPVHGLKSEVIIDLGCLATESSLEPSYSPQVLFSLTSQRSARLRTQLSTESLRAASASTLSSLGFRMFGR